MYPVGENIKCNNIVITGGSGFIGTNLVEYYVRKGYNVLNIDIKEPPNKNHISFWENIDINNYDILYKTLVDFKPNVIFHMAARTDLNGYRIEDYKTNIDGVKNLISACKKIPNLKRVIFASSKLVCRNGYVPNNDIDYCPDTMYGSSKVEGEKLIVNDKEINFSWVIVRPTSIWGPWFNEPYRNFFDKVNKGLYVHPKGINARKTYGFVGNTVYQLDKIMFSCDTLVDKKIIYLGDYEPIEIKHWADLISKEMGVRRPIEVPIFLLKSLGKVGDFFKLLGVNNFPYSSFRFKNILAETTFNLSNLYHICGELPYDLKMGVEETVKWLRDH
jgi:nucleoside-diphosphate-sugar epimerase